MKLFFYSFFIILFWSCGSSKKSTTPITEVKVETPPEWLMKRPMNTGYYIGISRVSKKYYPSNFSDEAKKKALDDLSQEIEVKVEANSILYTFSKNDSHKEDFIQSIKLESNIDLENYELVDSYETDTEYALYYRLSKSEYAAWKKSLEDKQIEIAKSWLNKTKEPNTTIMQEIEYELKAMEAIKEYWNKPLKTKIEQEEVFFGNYILSKVQESLDKIKLSINTSSIRLAYGMALEEKVLIVSAVYKGKTISDLPLKVVVAEGINLGQNEYSTDNAGKTSIVGLKSNKAKNVNLVVGVDFDRISTISNEVKMAIKSGLNIPNVNCVIQFETPKVYIKISSIGSPILTDLKGTLTGLALLNENKKSKADLICTISFTKREGGEYNGLFTSFLDTEITVTDSKGKLFLTKSYPGIKGVDLSYSRALVKALESFKSKFTYEIAPLLKKKLNAN